jgi:hypothetical protein
MVNSMKCTTLAVSILLFLSNPVSVLAEEPVITDRPSETVATEVQSSTTETAGNPRKKPCKGMGHQGKGQHGKGQGGMMHGGGQRGKGGHDKHRQVVQRLDMIEARLAKIEAMLEILMRR